MFSWVSLSISVLVAVVTVRLKCRRKSAPSIRDSRLFVSKSRKAQHETKKLIRLFFHHMCQYLYRSLLGVYIALVLNYFLVSEE